MSRYLKELEDAGVIERARDRRFLYCRANRRVLGRLATLLRGADATGEERAAWRRARDR